MFRYNKNAFEHAYVGYVSTLINMGGAKEKGINSHQQIIYSK